MAIEREISGRDERPEGQVRLTTYESMGQCFLAPRLGAFRERYPEIELQLNMDNRPLNLSRREADLARAPGQADAAGASDSQDRHGGGRRSMRRPPISRSGASRAPSRTWPSTTSSTTRTPTRTSRSRAGSISRRASARVTLRCDSAVAQAAAAADGVGIAVLYCYLGDAHRGLKRILPKQQLEHDLWIAVHRDLQYAARVRAVIDFLVETAAQGRRGADGSGAEGALVPRPRRSALDPPSDFVQGEARRRRNTVCISRRSNEALREKSRRSGSNMSRSRY